MYQIAVFVPKSDLSKVKQAMFIAGAGKYGHYDCCSWQTLGCGQFRPKQNAKPSIGTINKITTIKEYKLEMICATDRLSDVIIAMKTAHSYETVAYQVIKLSNQ